jgi:hypothetical protein
MAPALAEQLQEEGVEGGVAVLQVAGMVVMVEVVPGLRLCLHRHCRQHPVAQQGQD